MHKTNINNLDLNLLVSLEALLATSSVSRAAQHVGLSQPAMSRALERLRHMMEDPLLVRNGRSMVLTPRALTLRPLLDEALGKVRHLLAPDQFEPATSQRKFVIMGADHMIQILLPGVLEKARDLAPHITLDIVNLSPSAFEGLMNGDIDLGFGVVDNGPDVSTAYHQALFDDHFVMVMRKGHALDKGECSIEDFAAAPQAMLSITGQGRGVIDFELEKLGLKREIKMRLPHFLAVHAVISSSDYVMAIPRSLARVMPGHGVVVRDLPKGISGHRYTVSQIWHERFHHDPAHKWLRQLIKDASTPMRHLED